jgi:protein gp37
MGVERYRPTVRVVKGHPVWTGALVAAPDATWAAPLRRRQPATWFVNSMSDLFHEVMPQAWIERAFAVMAAAPQHRFLILTKRPDCMLTYVREHGPCPPNVWLGTSVEDQRRAAERLPILVQVPCATRFVSVEPLLEAVDLSAWLPGLQWLIVGAESGRGARPFDPAWARSLRDQCTAAGVAFFYKQDATSTGRKLPLPMLDGRQWAELPA